MPDTVTKSARRRQTAQLAPAIAPRNSSDSPIGKLRTLAEYTQQRVVGRETVIDAVLLGIVAGQNCLLLGVPGTAKTMLVQTMSEAFGPGACFDILLTKFTKADEVMGPVDLAALRNSEYRIKPAGYLPHATLGVIDEVFKGSSAIMNSMLRLANERTYRNGPDVEKSSLRSMIGMSNEWPEDPTTLAAFFDRFPIKLMVDYLDAGDFAAMLRKIATPDSTDPCPVSITDEDLQAIDAAVRRVTIDDEFVGLLVEIRDALRAKGIVISDRRWGQAIRLMQAHAVLNNRTRATRSDLSVLELVAWNEREQLPVIRTILPEYANPFERDLRMTLDELHAARTDILKAANTDGHDQSRQNPDMQAAMRAASRAISTVGAVRGRLDAMSDDVEEDAHRDLLTKAQGAVAEVEGAIRAVSSGRDGIEAIKKLAFAGI